MVIAILYSLIFKLNTRYFRKTKELLKSDEIEVEDLKASLNNICGANNNLEEKVIKNSVNTKDK